MSQSQTRLDQAFIIADGLVEVAQVLSRAAARAAPRSVKPPRGLTLRPGLRTPLWTALLFSVRPRLRRRGSKINLGRFLGVPPQRIHEYFVIRTAAPDAERTLLLLIWLAREQRQPPRLNRSR